MPSPLTKPPQLTPAETYEFESYIKTFTTASDRVRHILIIWFGASILVFAAYRNSLADGWLSHRIELARLVDREDLFHDGAKKLQDCFVMNNPAAGDRRRCKNLESALAWLEGSGHGPKSFEKALTELEKARISGMQIVEDPFLGIRFDISDLGNYSAICLSAIAIMLLYSMARYDENLYLCLERVRSLGELESRHSDGQSKANFLYHFLAMAQNFSQPPTLARWDRHYLSRIAPTALFFVPVLVQLLVFQNDWATRAKGNIFSSSLIKTTLALHVYFGLILIFATTITVLYSHASERRWRVTFFEINPDLRYARPPSRFSWVLPRRVPRYRFAEAAERLYIVSLDKYKAWDVTSGILSLANPIFIDAPHEALADSLHLKDGLIYEVMREEGKLKIKSVPQAIQVAELESRGVLSSNRGIQDIAEDSTGIFLVDSRERCYLKIGLEGGTCTKFGDVRGPWSPVAIACRRSRVYVAEITTKSAIFYGMLPGELRVRVLDSAGKEVETPLEDSGRQVGKQRRRSRRGSGAGHLRHLS